MFSFVLQIKEKLIQRCNPTGEELTYNPFSAVFENKQYHILKTNNKVLFYTEVAAVIEFNSNWRSTWLIVKLDRI